MDFILQDDCCPGRSHYDNNRENPVVKCMRLKGEDAVNVLREALDAGLDFDSCCYGFILACYLGNYEIVETLIKYIEEMQSTEKYVWGSPQLGRKSCLLNTYNDVGQTPLLSTIYAYRPQICCLLIKSGADVNLPHQMSLQSPLIVAMEQGHDDIVKLLLDNDADPQQCDNVGITPLYTAIKSKNTVVVKWILEAGCDVNIGSQDHSPLFLATRMCQLNMVQMLCEAGCYKDIKNKYGVTPVYEAAMKGHDTVLKYLLKVGSNTNIVDMYDQSPLHVAVIANSVHCVKTLVEGGANMKLRNHNRDSAMDLCLQMGRASILEYFLEEDLDVYPSNPSRKNFVTLFEQEYASTLAVLFRACTIMPMLDCVGYTIILPIFRNKPNLLKLLMHSGIETMPSGYIQKFTEISDWFSEFKKTPRSLKDISRISVRRCLGNKVLSKVKTLSIPTELKHYVTLRIL